MCIRCCSTSPPSVALRVVASWHGGVCGAMATTAARSEPTHVASPVCAVGARGTLTPWKALSLLGVETFFVPCAETRLTLGTTALLWEHGRRESGLAGAKMGESTGSTEFRVYDAQKTLCRRTLRPWSCRVEKLCAQCGKKLLRQGPKADSAAKAKSSAVRAAARPEMCAVCCGEF